MRAVCVTQTRELEVREVPTPDGAPSGHLLIEIEALTFMAKNLTIKTFSNFNSATARDPVKLRQALEYLHTQIADPLFRTKIGKTLRFDQIREAMAYETQPGAKAVLLPRGEL